LLWSDQNGIANAPLAVNTVTGEGWKQRFDLSTDATGRADVPYPWTTARLDVGVLASGWSARFATWRTDLDSTIPADYTIGLDRVTTSMGGWLRDEKGQPVANAVLQLEFGGSDMAQEENPRERPGFPWPAPVARSDRDGRWTCAVVDSKAKRTPKIRAIHSGFAPAEIALGSSGGEASAAQSALWSGDLVTIMHAGVRLLGKVTDEQDRAISGAQIIHKPSSSDLLHTETDEGGWFAFDGVPSAEFDFIVTAAGFAQQYVNVPVQDGMPPANIRLVPGGVLRLHVVDENEADVAGAVVGLTGLGGMYSPSVYWNADSEPDGRVEWTSGSPVRLRVEADGYVPFVSEPLPVQPGISQALDVVLKPVDPDSVVRGIVWRTDGQPASGAEVALLSPEHGASLGRACFAGRSQQDQLIVNADAAGSFSFPSEPAGSAVLAVCSNGFARVQLSDRKAPVELRLHPWGRLEGKIEPSARSRTVAYVEMDDLLALNSPCCVRLDRQAFSKKSSDDDHFSFEFVPDGLLCVWLDAGVIEDPHVPALHHATWVQVNPGETATIAIGDAGLRVKGRFVMRGREGDWATQNPFAALESEWPPSSRRPGQSLDARQWINTFLDPGRLIISSNGQFQSRDALLPGKYRLVGRIEGLPLDQRIELPNPANDVVLAGAGLFDSGQGSVIDLGDIPIDGEQAGTAK
jgi:hypothetical protein